MSELFDDIPSTEIEEAEDGFAIEPARRLAATLDLDPDEWDNGSALPPFWHWIYFVPQARTCALATDGHPRDALKAPTDLPVTMYGGVRLVVHRPLEIGRPGHRRSQIVSTREREGSTGRLLIVTMHHRVIQDDVLCVEEWQDMVYLARASSDTHPQAVEQGAPPGPAASWQRSVTMDPVMLFRFSALTFNAHRIHYDSRYATEVEGYADLLVHGPLTALLLAELVRERAGRPPARIGLKATAPWFVNHAAVLCGEPAGGGAVRLFARSDDGIIVMRGSASLE